MAASMSVRRWSWCCRPNAAQMPMRGPDPGPPCRSPPTAPPFLRSTDAFAAGGLCAAHEEPAMNHSMLTCGRTAHLKIVAVALIAAVLFATVGLKARLDDSGAGNVTASVKAGGPAMKAGKPALYST